MTSATEPAIVGAFSPQPRQRLRRQVEGTVTRLPLFFTRLRQIGSPITPRPMKPMVL